MSGYFVGKTSLVDHSLLWGDSAPVLSEQPRLKAYLETRVGQTAAALFAEALITPPTAENPGSVSWYAASSGHPEALPSLAADRRALAEGNLREVLSAIEPLLHDQEIGALLSSALVIPSLDHVLWVDGRIILTGWGMVRKESGQSEPRRDLPAHPVLAPFMSNAARPLDVTPQTRLQNAPPPNPDPHTRQSPTARTTAPTTIWRVPIIAPLALIIGLIFLVGGIWLGSVVLESSRSAFGSPAEIADPAALRAAIVRQQQENKALERDIEARRKALQGKVCTADPAALPGFGPDRQAPVPAATVPPQPGAQPFHGSLASLLDQAVVLVMVPVPQGMRTGSGFFVGPNLIVTNRHVIQGVDPSSIIVANKKLGGPRHVSLLAMTPSDAIGGADLALLRIDGNSGIQPLSLTKTVQPLDEVIAAGFPALLMQSDANFERLLKGNVQAMPQIILTDGRINAIQTTDMGIQIMPHSAAVSGGNSGGPLVDACGRVVGINTFIAADKDQVAHANYAQKADDVITFLQQNNAAATVVSGPCQPQQPVASAAPASPLPAAK